MTNNPIGLLQPSLKRMRRQDKMKHEKIKGNSKYKIIVNFIFIYSCYDIMWNIYLLLMRTIYTALGWLYVFALLIDKGELVPLN